MEKIIEKDKMDALKALSNVNLKISEAKNVLEGIKKEEAQYIESREKEVTKKIENVLEESRLLITETKSNYQEAKELYINASSLAQFLVEVYGSFTKAKEEFDRRNELWDANFKQQGTELVQLRKEVEIDQKGIESEKKGLEIIRENIKTDRQNLESQRVTLAISYEAEKELWNKIQQNKK